MTALYILHLLNHHFLVTDTISPPITSWLMRYPPVSMRQATGSADADALTLELMAIYGTDCVRGGSYTDEHLTIAQLLTIESCLYDRSCTQCGQPGHYAAVCWPGPLATDTWDINGCEINDDTDADSAYYDDDDDDTGYDSQDSE